MYKVIIRNIILVLSLVTLIGCKPVKEIVKIPVPVEVIKEVEKKVYVHDSTFVHDSIIIYQKGDTVFKEKIKYIYVQNTVHDTLLKKDSIEKPVYITNTVTETVEKPQWWPVWLVLGIVLLYFVITKTTFIEKLKILIKYFIKLFK